MKLTVDASVVVKWFVDEPLSEESWLFLAHRLDLYAPAILITEFANTIRKKVRRGEIPDSGPYFDELAAIAEIVDLLPDADVIERAAWIAVEIGHPVYDCQLSCMCRCQIRKTTTRCRRPLPWDTGSRPRHPDSGDRFDHQQGPATGTDWCLTMSGPSCYVSCHQRGQTTDSAIPRHEHRSTVCDILQYRLYPSYSFQQSNGGILYVS